MPLLAVSGMSAFAKDAQAVIEDTGSTNRTGLRVTIDSQGQATLEPRSGETKQIQLKQTLCEQFLRDVKAIGPLNELPARHCAKSVSFGYRLFVEYEGQRSPDLTCPTGEDSRLANLKKEAEQLLQAAREAAGVPARRVIRVPIETPPKS